MDILSLYLPLSLKIVFPINLKRIKNKLQINKTSNCNVQWEQISVGH